MTTERYTCSRCSGKLKSIHYCPNCEEDPRTTINRLEVSGEGMLGASIHVWKLLHIATDALQRITEVQVDTDEDAWCIQSIAETALKNIQKVSRAE